jgi:hypothetical protein
MTISVTIAGSAYVYADTTTKDWGGMNTSVVQAICNNAVWTNDIKDNLTSTDTDKPLSANQGKTLEDNKADSSDVISTSDLDATPADDANTTVTSKWVYDNIYNPTYDSGWITPSDYTNGTETITHSLGVAFEDTDFKILWSASGADGTDNIDVTNLVGYKDSPGTNAGQWLEAGSNNNTVKLRTGASGGLYFNASGNFTTITTGKFRVIIRKAIFK